jgi:hypothetical protein
LSRDIAGHDVKTAWQMGWTAIRNSELLALVAEKLFVTIDRNLSYQQNIANVRVAVIVLRAKSNRLADLRPLVPKLLPTFGDTKAGRVSLVGD